MADKILEVKNLQISFRTQTGILHAVRNISFDLERGETLAIVGESGSGKSVTSKAILGILAGNSIVNSGEILYDGKDLLKIPEDEMYKIRGDKISMIFQNPLSSLNPIVKIGKQLTEAMLLKSKVNRRQARKEFNTYLKVLQKNMIAAVDENDTATISEIKAAIKTFDNFNIVGTKLAKSFNESMTAAMDISAAVEDMLFRISRKAKVDRKDRINSCANKLSSVKDDFFVNGYKEKLAEYKTKLRECARKVSNWDTEPLPEDVEKVLTGFKDTLEMLCTREKPDFFRIGYYKLTNPQADLLSMKTSELNSMTLKYLDTNFMNRFLELAVAGIKYSYETALEYKKQVLEEMPAYRDYYRSAELVKSTAKGKCADISTLVEKSIDRLEHIKDSAAYTFRSGLSDAIDQYFHYEKNNPKEEARFARQSARRDRLIARGKKVDWKVTPKNIVPLEDIRGNMLLVTDRLTTRYENYLEASKSIDFRARAIDLVDFFKARANDVVSKVTKSMAREKAIKLMEEVGIPEPRIRYYQYPFEFSGGMRQRIVIAIALAANPDILICDEPTTALDVTIQAQILELINKLKAERNLSVIFITHDLGVVANMADKIAVMYAGKIVEYGTADDIFYDPRHPYTWALLSSMPDLDTSEKLDAIPGTPPNMIYPPAGDAFAVRNKYALKIDFEEQPPIFKISDSHWAATWLLHPDAPKVDIPKTITDRIERMRARDKLAEGGENNG